MRTSDLMNGCGNGTVSVTAPPRDSTPPHSPEEGLALTSVHSWMIMLVLMLEEAVGISTISRGNGQCFLGR